MPYNKKIVIVYKTKHGSTMKYAGWLAIKLNADLYEVSDLKRWDLLKYRTIVYGGPIYNCEIYGLNYILDRYKTIQNKNIIVFCVGLNLQSREEVMDYNFPEEEMKSKIKVYFLEGALNYKELNKIDKTHIKKLKNNNSAGSKFLYKEYERNESINIDKTNKKNVQPILDYILKKTYLLGKYK